MSIGNFWSAGALRRFADPGQERRQLKPERASLAGLGLNAHPATHRFRTSDDDRQADPRAGEGLGGVEPFKAKF